MNLEPSLIPYNNGVIEICFSPEFQKIYDAEVDYIDYIIQIPTYRLMTVE